MEQNSTIVVDEIFTHSEMEIAALLAKDLSEKQIATRRFTSHNTVRTHTRNMRKKIGANSNIGIVVRYLRSLDNKSKHLIGIAFVFMALVFNTANTGQTAINGYENDSQVKYQSFKTVVESAQNGSLSNVDECQVRIKTDLYLILADWSNEGEVKKIEVFDSNHNRIEMSTYQRLVILKSLSNRLKSK